MRELELIQQIFGEVVPYVKVKYTDKERLNVSRKSDPCDLLTEADITVQHIAVERIHEAFPDDAVLAEELGMNETVAGANGRIWLIDPIDGTNNFVRGLFPTFGVSVAFVDSGACRAGGVALPMLNHVYLAEIGGGAFRNGERIHVSSVAHADHARADVDFGSVACRWQTVARGHEMICKMGQVLSIGATVVAMCSVACGEMDAFFHVHLSPWDYAAAQLLVTEAGGRVTTLNGKILSPFDGSQGVLASNGHIHDELLRLIPDD
jgi:myo-inositol-1(or 4)-monophosphatase